MNFLKMLIYALVVSVSTMGSRIYDSYNDVQRYQQNMDDFGIPASQASIDLSIRLSIFIFVAVFVAALISQLYFSRVKPKHLLFARFVLLSIVLVGPLTKFFNTVLTSSYEWLGFNVSPTASWPLTLPFLLYWFIVFSLAYVFRHKLNIAKSS